MGFADVVLGELRRMSANEVNSRSPMVRECRVYSAIRIGVHVRDSCFLGHV